MPTTHQLHSVENANRASRNAAGGIHRNVNVSVDTAEYTSEEIGMRATVVPIRDFAYKVKHRLDEDKADAGDPYDLDLDPINILGPVLEDQIPVVTSQDPTSLLAAFNKRCNFLQKDAKDDICPKEFKQAIALINTIPQQECWDENDEDRERWMNKFDPAKRLRMQEAWSAIDDATLRDIRNKTLMVKIETLLKRSDSTWAPRAIYIGSDAHNALTGPPMMVAMERLCAVLDTDVDGVTLGAADIRFGYKKNDVYLCEHLTRDAALTNLAEGDYSRNDREQRSKVALLIDQWLAKLGFPDWLRALMLDSSEEYEVYAPLAGLKAKLQHQLPTGTTATTFRNSAYNATMFAVSCLQQKITRARALVLGDDLLAATLEAINCTVWEGTVDRFKMVLKAARPSFDGKATFLSRRLVMQTVSPCLVPKIGKCLARYNVRATKNPALSDDEYMAGKSLAHAYEFRHAPAMSSLFLQRFKYHNDRVHLDLNAEVQHDSWFLKISGLTTANQIIGFIRNEKVIITPSDWEDWIAETYDVGWWELHLLCRQIILGTRYTVIETALFDAIALDF